jgi:hypothetical protein
MDTRSSDGVNAGSQEARITALRQRHANFDRQLQELRRSPSADQEIAILKVEKLRIKDEIARLTH